MFLDQVCQEFIGAAQLLEKRARGDYTPDADALRFPKFDAGPAGSSSGLSCWELFEAYVHGKKPAPATVERWRAVFLSLQERFPEKRASDLRESDAREWAKTLITAERTAQTVSDVWVASARRVFKWGVDEGLLLANPFAKIKVTIPKTIQHREDKAFTDEEAKLILRAALKVKPKTTFQKAQRWVPWLCAYSGARAGEITQLRAQDVLDKDGVARMKLTPEAGTIKVSKPRTVPLHEHIVAQGFLKFVRSVGRGPLFYNETEVDEISDPLKPKRPRYAKTRERLAGWIREDVGIKDPEVQPNHAWRHTFKAQAERCGISEKVSDAITGHAPANVARGYGKPTLADMARELKKFPRYKL